MKRYLLLLMLQVIFSCNIDTVDKKKVTQVSKSVLESKKNNVFIKEYSSSNSTLFSKVWLEELWILDSLNKITKLDQYNIYFKTDSNIGISQDSIKCSWCSNCGNKNEYLFSKISKEDILKDSLSFYFFNIKENKCLGKFTFKTIKNR